MRFLTIIPHNKSHIRVKISIIIRNAVNLSFKIIGVELEANLPPFILLHELLGSKKEWVATGKTLFRMLKRPVVAVDLRNHGDSPHTTSHKYEELAEDVLNLITRMGISRSILFGHSMGGNVAMCMALMKPAQVEKLIVVDISPLTECEMLKDTYPKILSAMQVIDFNKVKHKTVDNTRKFVKKELREITTDEVLLNRIKANINLKRDGTIGWTCNLDALIRNFQSIVSFPESLKREQYKGPTLFLAGQMSKFVLPNDKACIETIFPDAKVFYVPKAGHMPYHDDPKTFFEKLIEFSKKK